MTEKNGMILDSARLEPGATEPGNDLVFVVHGLSANRLIMWPLAKRLRLAGYDVINWGYRSTTRSIGYHAQQLSLQINKAMLQDPDRKIHLVGHSMGCIIIRAALEIHASDHSCKQIGRVVMLAPPNRGSHVASRLGPYVRWICPTMDELSDRQDSYVNRLPPPPLPPEGCEFGIVAARFDFVIDRAKTHLDGEKDFMVIASNHGAIPWRKITATKTINFLQTGFFDCGCD